MNENKLCVKCIHGGVCKYLVKYIELTDKFEEMDLPINLFKVTCDEFKMKQ